MSKEKKPWQRWQKLALGLSVFLFTVLVVLLGARKRWVQPLPGVRLEMTRPQVEESDLGPASAYRILLRACARVPASRSVGSGGRKIWQLDWTDAGAKLQHHPYPATPPPAGSEPEVEHAALSGVRDQALAPEAPWTLAQYQGIQRLLREYEPVFALLDQALADPHPHVPSRGRIGSFPPYLSQVREIARWSYVSSQLKADAGDYAGAFRDLDRVLGVANVICYGGLLINHLVGIGCDAIAANAVSEIATRRDVPAPILRQAAREFLAHADRAEPYVEAVRADQLGVDRMVEVWHEAADPNMLAAFGLSTTKPHGKALYRAMFLAARLAGSTPPTSVRNLENCYQHIVALAEKPFRASTAAEYDAFTAGLQANSTRKNLILRTRDPLGCLLASRVFPAFRQAHQKFTHRDASMRGTALLLAIKAYEKERGTPPERLEQLVPDYLPRVPQDPFDGKPFRYLPRNVPNLPPQAWAVYSVGEDFTDDGGEAQHVGLFRDPDLVWPSQPYPPPPLPTTSRVLQPAGE